MGHIVYVMQCTSTGKVYVGHTKCTLRRRLQLHNGDAKRVGQERALYIAIRKYGLSNFSCRVTRGNLSKQEAAALELKTIKRLNSLVPNGLNMSIGGMIGATGVKATRLAKQRRSASLKGTVFTKTRLTNMSRAAKLKWQDPNYRAKSLASMKNRPVSAAQLRALEEGRRARY